MKGNVNQTHYALHAKDFTINNAILDGYTSAVMDKYVSAPNQPKRSTPLTNTGSVPTKHWIYKLLPVKTGVFTAANLEVD